MSWTNVTGDFFFLSFQSVSFYFHFYNLLSASCCMQSSAWWVSYLVENEQSVPWRFQLFGSLKDLPLEYQCRGWKVKPEESQKKIRFFFSEMLFQEKKRLKICSFTAKKKHSKSKRLFEEICIFTDLHNYQDSFIAVLILLDVLEGKNKIKSSCFSSSSASSFHCTNDWMNTSVLSEEYQKTCNIALPCPHDLLARSVNLTLFLPGKDFLKKPSCGP